MRIDNANEWREVQSRGRLSFIVKHGLLRFGLTLMALTLLMLYVVYPLLLSASPPGLLKTLVASVIVWSLAGYAVADWNWHKYEKRFGDQDGRWPGR